MGHHVLVISLPGRRDRRERLTPMLEQCDIDRWRLIDGCERYAHALPNCVQAHMDALQSPIPAGDDLLILEDDAAPDPLLLSRYRAADKPDDWAIALPGGTIPRGTPRHSDDWLRVRGAFVGAQAVEYRAQYLPVVRELICAEADRLLRSCVEGMIVYLAQRLRLSVYRYTADAVPTFASYSDRLKHEVGPRRMYI